MSSVAWIEPQITNGVVRWPFKCEGEVVTPEARNYRERMNKPTQCEFFAKVDFRGAKLCVRHAQARALAELVEGVPGTGHGVITNSSPVVAL